MLIIGNRPCYFYDNRTKCNESKIVKPLIYFGDIKWSNTGYYEFTIFNPKYQLVYTQDREGNKFYSF